MNILSETAYVPPLELTCQSTGGRTSMGLSGRVSGMDRQSELIGIQHVQAFATGPGGRG